MACWECGRPVKKEQFDGTLKGIVGSQEDRKRDP